MIWEQIILKIQQLHSFLYGNHSQRYYFLSNMLSPEIFISDQRYCFFQQANHLPLLSKILANRCYMCQESEESIDHLILHCERTRVIWNLLFTIFKVRWVLLETVSDTLAAWHGRTIWKSRKKVWRMAPLYLFWVTWNQRNNMVFENGGNAIQQWKLTFVSNLWPWVRNVKGCFPLLIETFMEWLGSQ